MKRFTVKAPAKIKTLLSMWVLDKGYILWSENGSLQEYINDGWEIEKIDHYATFDHRHPIEGATHWQAVTLKKLDWENAKRTS